MATPVIRPAGAVARLEAQDPVNNCVFEHARADFRGGVIERQSVGASRSAIVPGEKEAIEPELAHDLDLVARRTILTPQNY